MYLFIVFPVSCQHSTHLPEGLHFLLKSKTVLSYLSFKQQGQNFIAKMPQQVSIFSYISHKSSLKEWTTSELGYNFPLHNGHVIPVHYYYEYIPNNNDNCTETFPRITVHKRSSALAIWRGRITEGSRPRCA